MVLLMCIEASISEDDLLANCTTSNGERMSFDITKKSWYSCDGICVEIGIGESRKTEPCGDKCPPGWCLKEGMCLEEMATYENGSKIMANEGSINHHMRKRKRLWKSCHGRCHEVHHHCRYLE